MNLCPQARRPIAIVLALFALVAVSPPSADYAPNGNAWNALQYPWLDRALSPDARAGLVLNQMTLDEKISLLHGTVWHGLGTMNLEVLHSNGGVGYVVGIPRRCRTILRWRPLGMGMPPMNTARCSGGNCAPRVTTCLWAEA